MTVGADPLLDTLFRSTGGAGTVVPFKDSATGTGRPTTSDKTSDTRDHAGIGSELPVRAEGTRSRAGNSMPRTRTALIDGARKAAQAQGTRLSMAQIASDAGVAKATLYNHFRTREAVLDALLMDEIVAVLAQTANMPLQQALSHGATAISLNDLRKTLAQLEPHTLARLACVEGWGWATVRQVLQTRLAVADPSKTEVLIRWLSSFLLSPAEEPPSAMVAALLSGLSDGTAGVTDVELADAALHLGPLENLPR